MPYTTVVPPFCPLAACPAPTVTVTVDILDGPSQGRYFGAASIGERPTFGVYKPNLEVFLFDFHADIYGANISVALVNYQRPELKFDTLETLIVQMDLDCEITILLNNWHYHLPLFFPKLK